MQLITSVRMRLCCVFTFVLQGMCLYLLMITNSQAQALPTPGLYNEILAQIYEVDGPSTRWIPVPLDNELLNPNLGDQLGLPYEDPPFFSLNSRSGYVGGLGITSETGLPEIDNSGEIFLIRSNALVRARSIRHLTAHSPGGESVPVGLLMYFHGTLGYIFDGPLSDPFAFERILDSGTTVEVVVHRQGKAPVTVWAAGASLIKSADIDLPLIFYGEFKQRHWTETGTSENRQAEFNYHDYGANDFTVNDGETFAIEFIMTGTSRNYEYPNWRSFAELFNSLDGSPIPDVAGHFLQIYTPLSDFDFDFEPIIANSRVGASIEGADQNHDWEGRPPTFSPIINLENDQTFYHSAGDVRSFARDIASVNPYGAYGFLGAQARVSVSAPALPAASPLTNYAAAAQPSYRCVYMPGTGGQDIEEIDIDLDLVLEGSMEFRARDEVAFNQFISQGLNSGHARLKLFATVKSSTRSSTVLSTDIRFNGNNAQSEFKQDATTQIQSHFVFTPIPASGPPTGGRLSINLDTRSLPPADPLVVALQDILTISSGDYIKVFMEILAFALVDEGSVQYLDAIDTNFFDTMQPIISTDTPGVEFLIADELGVVKPVFMDGFEKHLGSE